MVSLMSCSKDKDTIVPDQRESFEKYLDGKKWEYTVRDGVYQYVRNASRSGYDSALQIERGDSVEFSWSSFLFRSNSFDTLRPFYTNDLYVLDYLKAAEQAARDQKKELFLVSKDWDAGVDRAKVGTTKMVTGIARGIVGARDGDDLLLFVTSDMAYGGNKVGLVPEDSPIVFNLKISKVVKQ